MTTVQPNISKDHPASKIDWKLIWNDEFSAPALNKSKWRIEDIMPDYQGNLAQASQHVTNTFGFDTDGNKIQGKFPHGKRHACWYDKHHDKTIKLTDKGLELGAYKSDERDPTIKDSHHPYIDPRTQLEADFRNKIYTSWVDTYARTWDNGAVRPSPKNSPNFYFVRGYVECGVNFERMRTRGLRMSAWILPAVDPKNPTESLNGTTYNADPSDGLECDLFETEHTPGAEHLLLCKNIGANAKNIPAVDCRKFGIDITKGDHTIAVLWTDESTTWFVDGIEVAKDDQAVPDIAGSIHLTREGNSCAGSGDGITPVPPYIQSDTGLFGGNLGVEPKSKIDADVGVFRYVRVFQNPAQKDNWIAPAWANGEGIESTTTVLSTNAPAATPIVEEQTQSVSVNESIAYSNGKLTWPANGNNKWNVDIGKDYLTTVEGTPEFTPTKSGDYSVYPVINEKLKWNQRSGIITVDLNAAKSTPAEAEVIAPAKIVPPVKQDAAEFKENILAQIAVLKKLIEDI